MKSIPNNYYHYYLTTTNFSTTPPNHHPHTTNRNTIPHPLQIPTSAAAAIDHSLPPRSTASAPFSQNIPRARRNYVETTTTTHKNHQLHQGNEQTSPESRRHTTIPTMVNPHGANSASHKRDNSGRASTPPPVCSRTTESAANRQSTLHETWTNVASMPPKQQRGSKAPRPAGTSPMKTDGVAPNVDATSTRDGKQEEGDSTSMNSFDADVEGIRRNLEEKLAGAESTVGSNATSTAESKGADDAMGTDSAGSTATPPPDNQSTGAATNQATGGTQSTGAAGDATGAPHSAAASSATNNAANSAWTPRDATSASNINKKQKQEISFFLQPN